MSQVTELTIIGGLFSLGWKQVKGQGKTFVKDTKAVIVTENRIECYDRQNHTFLGDYPTDSQDRMLFYFLGLELPKLDQETITKYGLSMPS